MKVYNRGQKINALGTFFPARRETTVADTPEMREAIKRKAQLSIVAADRDDPPPPTQVPTEPEPPVVLYDKTDDDGAE